MNGYWIRFVLHNTQELTTDSTFASVVASLFFFCLLLLPLIANHCFKWTERLTNGNNNKNQIVRPLQAIFSLFSNEITIQNSRKWDAFDIYFTFGSIALKLLQIDNDYRTKHTTQLISLVFQRRVLRWNTIPYINKSLETWIFQNSVEYRRLWRKKYPSGNSSNKFP